MRAPAYARMPSAIRRSLLLWGLLAIFAVVAMALFLGVGFRIDAPELPRQLTRYFAAAGIAQLALQRGIAPRLSYAVVTLLQMTGLAGAAMLLTYSAASVGMPLVDSQLLSFDRAVRYDWFGYAAFVAGHDWIAVGLWRGYALIFALPVIVIFPLAFHRRFREIDRYLIATAIALIIAAMIFTFCPALTAWDHLGIDPHLISRLRYLPNSTISWEHDLIEIRAGRGFDIHTTAGSGLIAFPSFHCIAGVLAVWAIWPVKMMRPVVLPAVAVLIASAPIIGGHYMADLIAGAGVAWFSALAAQRIERLMLT